MGPTHERLGPIALIGLGTIGVSFLSLYFKHTGAAIRIYDPREDIEEHIAVYVPLDPARITICKTIQEACCDAAIVQEQGPENLEFKQSTWSAIIAAAPPYAHLWSSTSGITASQQVARLSDKTRLLVVHPFNPPHIMPLIEIVPSPFTSSEAVDFAQSFFTTLGAKHVPVVIKEEIEGFVGNRLAFILFREACYLVSKGVATAETIDKVVEASLGPRWTAAGPMKTYHYGGGLGGLGAFFNNLHTTMQAVWDTAGEVSFGSESTSEQSSDWNTAWSREVIEQTERAYGQVDQERLKQHRGRLEAILDCQRSL